jgi:hypothetical protein
MIEGGKGKGCRFGIIVGFLIAASLRVEHNFAVTMRGEFDVSCS